MSRGKVSVEAQFHELASCCVSVKIGTTFHSFIPHSILSANPWTIYLLLTFNPSRSLTCREDVRRHLI